ncbi:MAG: phosphotransferase enzyme family protein [Cyanobium sp.]
MPASETAFTPEPAPADPARIAACFRLPGPVSAVAPLGNGNVNDTYRVRVKAEGEPSFVLQRLNTHVFRQPRLVMANLQIVSDHVQRRLAAGAVAAGRRWEMPAVMVAHGQENPWLEEGGDFWRAISFIEHSRSVEVPESGPQARELGRALGTFHDLIHDLPVERLADTLEGFHVTPGYLAAYRRALAAHAGPGSAELGWATAFVAAREDLAAVLEQARERGELRLRPIHGDPKVNNVLLDSRSGEAIALVDLDTVKPGLVQWDIGDCLRSACNRLGEETGDWEAVRFDLDLCEALLGGYLGAARGFLDDADFAYLLPAIRLIAFELGLRFLADHLAGDVYFRTSRPGHNLQRALVQFRLTESIEAQQGEIGAIIERLRRGAA